MEKIDHKKKYPEFYAPKTTPSVIDIPTMKFIMVNGKGNPNEEGGEYAKAVEVLYALSYTIKMGLKTGPVPEGYVDYTVLPLEGLWWFGDPTDPDFTKKDKYQWCSMIRQPDFITKEIFEAAKEKVHKKKPELDLDKARFTTFREGLCVQVMHLGPYDTEPATVQRMDEYRLEQGYLDDLGGHTPEGHVRTHHEIYLSNPLTTEPSKMKTILRHPVKKVD